MFLTNKVFIKYILYLATILAFVNFAYASPIVPVPKIFQIGFNKCGTTTLADFFNANGVRSAHWEDGGNLAASIYDNYLHNRPLLTDYFKDNFIGYFEMSSIHVPNTKPIDIGLQLFRELDKQYPGSKFILNTRDKQAWLRSRSNHITSYGNTYLERFAEVNGVSRAEMLAIWSQQWDDHHRSVQEYFKDRPQDLLIYNIETDTPEKIQDFFKDYFILDPELYQHKNKTKVIGSIIRKPGFDFFDMIYCLNLPQSIDRYQHIVEEFKRVGIKKYQFFVGTDKDSPEVKNIMRSRFVNKYPPCFRCNKIFCKCTNNVLINAQIGNWLSFINIFKDIVSNNYEYVLITEDDVKFTDDARQILDNLINFKKFADYNIDVNKPLLLRLFGKFEPESRDLSDIKFVNATHVSNPCFIVNKKFAESFLQHLKKITTTSDVYVHFDLPKLDSNVQHFSVVPKPAYELSDDAASGIPAQFHSTIHPKGIDEADRIREQRHKKRIEYKEYLLSQLGLGP